MKDEFHDVVKLLLKRMDSHPGEFSDTSNMVSDEYNTISEGSDRWWRSLAIIREWGSEEEKRTINARLRKIKLNEAHNIAMDELLNGDERRAKQRAQEDAYKTYARQAQLQQQVQMQHQYTQMQQTYEKTYPLGNLSGVSGLSVPSRYPTATDVENNGIVNTLKRELGIK